MPDSNADNVTREAKIRDLLAQEVQDGESLAAEARSMVEFLLREKKGYASGDIRKGSAFEVALDGEAAWSSVDFIVSLEGRIGMIIKCAAGSLDSRQRQAVAAARVITSPPVPVAVVADPVTAQVLDGSSGRLIGEGFGAIPVRDRLQEILAASGAEPLSPSRREKEKRILLAFDAIKCCVPQGADGGVRIGGSCDGEVSQD
jgi:hypothetical protein